jgi:predicted transcriptional regulator
MAKSDPVRQSLTFKLPRQMRRSIVDVARKREQSPSSLVRLAVREFLEREVRRADFFRKYELAPK